jgi:hypothetical protein
LAAVGECVAVDGLLVVVAVPDHLSVEA